MNENKLEGPRCIVCREPLDLEEHLERLNANQPIRDLYERAGLSDAMAPLPMCVRCKTEEGRAEEITRRVDEAMERHRAIRRRFEEEDV